MLKQGRSVANSFISYGFWISKMLLGERFGNPNNLFFKTSQNFLFSGVLYSIQPSKRTNRISKVIMLDFKIRDIITMPGIVNS